MANQRLNIDIVARDKSKQALNNVQGSLSRLKNSVFNLRNAFLGLGAGLVIKNLVNTGKQLESLNVRLKFLFGSANEGAKAFDKMAKFASRVPFSLEEIQQGAGVLSVVSKDADELAHILEITGNVAAVTGLDFRTTAEQIQRSLSAGISSADLFRERGVKAMLGFSAGATVSVEQTVEAFNKVFGKNGRFGKATDDLAKTFEGTLSMIGDKVFNFKKVLLEAGFFDELKKQFGDLDIFLQNNAKDIDRIATSVGKNLAQGMVRVVQIGKDLIPTIQKIGSGLKSILDGFMSMPEFAREIGIIGAFLLGKKGAVGLAGISLIIDKVNDLVKNERIKSGLIDVASIEEAQLRLIEINKQLEDGLQKEYELVDVRGKGTLVLENYKKLTADQLANLTKQKTELEKYISLETMRNTKAFDHVAILHQGLKTHKEINEQLEKKMANTNRENGLIRNQNQHIETLMDKIKKLNDKSLTNVESKFKNIKGTISEGINNSITTMSQGLARAFVFGEKLSDTLRNMAQKFLANIISALIEVIARKGVELAIEKMITNEKRKQAMLSASSGGSFFSAIGSFFGGGKASGGSVQKGKPYMVGEQGAELFVPNQSGQIQQSARGTGGGQTTVNFNINTVDASGFEELLVRSRGTITQLINSAVNERGSRNLI